MAEVKVEKGLVSQANPVRRPNSKPCNGRHGRQPVSRFEGRCPDLKGFTFDCAEGRHADSYNLSIKELALYVGRIFTYSADLKWTIEHEKLFVAPKPENIDIAKINATYKRIWEKRVEEYVKRDIRLTENCEKLYSLILGQFTEYMKSKLESLLDYDVFNEAVDVVALIKTIKGLTYQFESQRYHSQALHKAICRFYRFYQTKDMSNAMFLENFQTLVSVVEDYGGTIGTGLKEAKAELIKEGIDVDNASDASKGKAMETAKNRYLAMAMLTAADVARYSHLLEDLDNDYTKGNDNYPCTVTEAYNLIINYRQARPAARIYHDAEGNLREHRRGR
jgi:hypothetical protein